MTNATVNTPEMDDGAPSAATGARVRYPLSASQMRYWERRAANPNAAGGSVSYRRGLSGRIDPDIVEAAFRRLIERHEILRTSFIEVDGAPMQEAAPHAPFTLERVDLRDAPAAERLEQADAACARMIKEPFDLAAAPLFRAMLVQVEDREAIVQFLYHGAVIDGWSHGVLTREFGVIVDALQNGRAPELPPVGAQFGQYAAWRNALVESPDLDEERAFWRRTLAGAPRFEIETDRPRPPVMAGAGEIRSLLLPADLNAKMVAYARETRQTLFQVAATSLTAMLSRTTGQTDIVIGAPMSNRDEVELETMVGPELNQMALRFDASGDPTFETLAERTLETVGAAMLHQRLPFQTVVDLVGAPKDLSRTPLYSVELVQQSVYIDTGRTGNMVFENFEITSVPGLPSAATTDLVFFLVGRDEGWRISCEANADLFDVSTVDRLLRRWAQTLDAMLSSEGRATIGSVAYPDVDRFTPGPVPGLAAAAKSRPASTPVQEKPSAEPSGRVAGDDDDPLIAEMTAIWREVLERPQLRADGDFFDNGGHSLTAMRVISRVNKAYGLKLKVAQLFKAPTARRFAAVVAEARPESVAQPPAVEPEAARAPEPAPTPTPARGASAPAELSEILAIWREVLERPQLQADGDFFDNGGHSLTAMRVISRVNKAYGLKLKVAQLFKAPTPRRFADAVAALRPAAGDAEPAPAPSAPVTPPSATATPPSAAPSPLRAAPTPPRPAADAVEPPAPDPLLAEMIEIWREVLDRPALHADSDFFDNGGHSLTAMRVVSRVNRAYGLKLKVAQLFKAPTLRAFAREVAALLPEQAPVAPKPAPAPHPRTSAAPAPVVAPDGVAPIIALNNGAAFVVVERRLSDGREIIDVPLGDEEDAQFALHHSLEETVARIVDRIQAAQPSGPYYLLAFCALSPIIVEAARQLGERGEKVEMVAVLDSAAPGYFDSLSFMGKTMRLMIRLKRAGGYWLELLRDYRAGKITMAYWINIYGFARRARVVPILTKLRILKPQPEEEVEQLNSVNFFDAMLAAGYRQKKSKLKTRRFVAFCSNDVYRGRWFPKVLGWPEVIEGDVEEYRVPCEHRQMMREPFGSLIGLHIDKVIGEIEEEKRASGDA